MRVTVSSISFSVSNKSTRAKELDPEIKVSIFSKESTFYPPTSHMTVIQFISQCFMFDRSSWRVPYYISKSERCAKN